MRIARPMRVFRRARSAAAAGALVIFLSGVPVVPRAEPLAGPQSRRAGRVSPNQLWLLPSAQPGVMMRTTVVPSGGSRAVPARGDESRHDPERRTAPHADAGFDAMSQWFVRHGYAVAVPQRPGHGETGGAYREDQGGCDDADFARAGPARPKASRPPSPICGRSPFVRRNGVIVSRPVGRRLGRAGASRAVRPAAYARRSISPAASAGARSTGPTTIARPTA